MRDIDALVWPVTRLGEGVLALARAAGISADDAELANPPDWVERDPNTLSRWIEAAAGSIGVQVDQVQVQSEMLRGLLNLTGPSVLRFHSRAAVGYLFIVGGERRRLRLLSPDGRMTLVPIEHLVAALAKQDPMSPDTELDRMIAEAGLRGERAVRVRSILQASGARRRSIGVWLLRLAPDRDLASHFRSASVSARSVLMAGSYLVHHVLFLLAWWVIGSSAVRGRLDRHSIFAWALLLGTAVCFRLLATSLSGRLAFDVGAIIKQRLMLGALRMDPDRTVRDGLGRLLGRVIESDSFESLALSGGMLAALSLIDLVMGAVVLGYGVSGRVHLPLMATCLALAALLVARDHVARERWATWRFFITHDLIERLVGHRTRIVQEDADRWHDSEDQTLEAYSKLSRRTDHAAWKLVLIPRTWLLLALAVLAIPFVRGGVSVGTVAVSVGGILLVYRALATLMSAALHLSAAGVAWQEIRLLFEAATRSERSSLPAFQTIYQSNAALRTSPVLQAHNVVFRYPCSTSLVLRNCCLTVNERDRILLEGVSGSGKSTLAAVIGGLRDPQGGTVLFRGLDRQSLGAIGWRKGIAVAPQFHQNHVLSGSLAFNALLGRDWPPTGADLLEADQLLRELGLGPLLDRMPSGIHQMVGDMGWQLSHGERSRLFIARALLQSADVIFLDESFAALDPDTFSQSMGTLLWRAPALVVIAHP